MTLYQIIIPAFSFLMILSAFFRVLSKRQSWRELVLWTLFWGGGAFLALFPTVLDTIAHFFGVENGARAFLLVFMLILFFALFKIIIRLEKQEEQLTKLVRYEALKKLDKNDS